MRELKVRAWIERYQKYMPVSLINFEPISGKIVSIEVVATGGDWCKFYPEEYVLEQDTGLKDKNGKEIYEGDILRWKHYYSVTSEHKEYTERVYWEEKDACYVVGDWFEPLGSLVYEDAVELIGNIHESPELLGKEEK